MSPCRSPPYVPGRAGRAPTCTRPGQLPFVAGALPATGQGRWGPGLIAPERAAGYARIGPSTRSRRSPRSSPPRADRRGPTPRPDRARDQGRRLRGQRPRVHRSAGRRQRREPAAARGRSGTRACTRGPPWASPCCRWTRPSRSRPSCTCGTDRLVGPGEAPAGGAGTASGRSSSDAVGSRRVVDHPISRDPGLGGRAAAWLASADRVVVEPRGASTVMLVRDGAAGVEVYVQRRVATMAFAPSTVVFPGGGIDPADSALPVATPGLAEPPPRWGRRSRWRLRMPRRPCVRSRRSAGCGCRSPTCAGGRTG